MAKINFVFLNRLKQILKVKKCIFLVISLYILYGTTVFASNENLFINEFCASNNTLTEDSFGDKGDWVELYNSGDIQLNLEGLYLTDDLLNLQKWKFPTSTLLLPKEFIIVWLDKDDLTKGGLHTNFKLSSDGEFIALVDSDGTTIIDSLSFDKQYSDITFGRYPDGGDHWGFLETATPAKANTSSFSGIVPKVEFSHERGFYDAPINLTLTCLEKDADIYYTIDHSDPESSIILNDGKITLGSSEIGSANSQDGWKTNILINLFNTYKNTSDTVQNISITGFNFYASRKENPVTPFVVRIDGVSDYYTLAVGKTRTSDEYQIGNNSFPFTDTEKIISVNPGESITSGFMDFYPDGSGGSINSVIPYNKDDSKQIIYFGQADGSIDGTVSENQNIPIPASPLDLYREYMFQAEMVLSGFGASEPETITTGILYTRPIAVDKTTTIKCFAVKPGWKSQPIQTHSFLYLNEIANADYMWTEIKNSAKWKPLLIPALKDLPNISITTTANVSETEIKAAIEFINMDEKESFQVNAGIEHYGGHSLTYPKKSMRLSFKAKYGDSKLKYSFYGDSATNEFDQILLRTGSHDGVFYDGDDNDFLLGVYVRNRWAFDRQRDMGHITPHGRFVHVYLNNEYIGQHNLMERPNAAFMASYFGGNKEDYSALNKWQIIDGDISYWNSLENSSSSFSNLEKHFDLESYADYMLLQYYGGNDWDWKPHQNWMAAGSNSIPMNYQFFAWDSDLMLRTEVDANVVDVKGPARLWDGLWKHKEFRFIFADRAQKFLIDPNGILASENVSQQFRELATEIDTSIIAELARWGSEKNYTPDTWTEALEELINDYLKYRTEITIEQLEDAGYLPAVTAPDFYVGNKLASADLLEPEDRITLKAPKGVIYFTTDGSDPYNYREKIISPTATTFSSDIEISEETIINTRARYGSTWSALNTKLFKLKGTTPINRINFTQNSNSNLFSACYPNPFTDETTINYGVTNTGNVNISIYSITGQLVTTLIESANNPGDFIVKWDGTNSQNKTVEPGYYIGVYQSDETRISTKIIFKP